MSPPKPILPPPKPYTSGALAKAAGVNPETLRYYEREGLLAAPERTESGYRQYPQDALQQVAFIKRAQALGFSLAEIKGLLTLRLTLESHSSKTPHAGPLKALAVQKLATIEEKIRDLTELKTSLESLISGCAGEEIPLEECPILQELENQPTQQKGGE